MQIFTRSAITKFTLLKSVQAKDLPRFALSLLLALGLTACESFAPKKVVEEPPAPAPKPAVVYLPSAEPIVNASDEDIRFAQTVLNQLGYKIGEVDGIWGPRSAREIRNFERINGLTTANGLLSELNLTMLERIGNAKRGSTANKSITRSGSIGSKLNPRVPLEGTPQLVILDQQQELLAKPNPFSEILTTLANGTGIYVIRLQEGWYEVESEDRIRGYIKAR